MKLSVIICTHNPRADYMPRALAALAAQTLAHDAWELLIIDNCSTEPVAGRFDLGWRPDVRFVREDKLGLTPARLRGIQEARGDLLVFVDDDNVLDPDYLVTALRIARERPWLGAWSGQCRAEFEVQPEEWTRRYWGNLCIREFATDVWSNLPRLPETMAAGAGLCVRKAVGAEYVRLHETGARPFEMDRTGNSLMSGGDNDLAACACDIGLGQGLTADLKLTHLISRGRTTLDYLARLAEGIYFSAVVISHMRGEACEVQSYRVRRRDKLRALVNRGPHRRIALAVLRGRRKGLAFLANLPSAARGE